MSYCPRCGEQTSEEARFCQKCGLPINGNQYSDNFEAEPIRKDNSSLKRLGIIAALIIAICPAARAKVGVIFLIGAIVAFILNASYAIIVALICCNRSSGGC